MEQKAEKANPYERGYQRENEYIWVGDNPPEHVHEDPEGISSQHEQFAMSKIDHAHYAEYQGKAKRERNVECAQRADVYYYLQFIPLGKDGPATVAGPFDLFSVDLTTGFQLGQRYGFVFFPPLRHVHNFGNDKRALIIYPVDR